jgi:hypothetical protein
MGPRRRRRDRVEETSTQPEYLATFLAQPPQVGTSDADVEAVAKSDADHAAEAERIARFVKTEEAFDRNAPRPPVINIDY